MEWIFLLLALVVVIFGVGVLLVSRLRDRAIPPGRDTGTVAAPPRPRPPQVPPESVEQIDDIDTFDVVEIHIEIDEPLLVEPTEEIVKPRFRDRLARARATLAGAFSSVRDRDAITAETWDDLEEALIGADVGVSLSMELLDELRDTVKAEKITDPSDLLDRLKAQMLQRVDGLDRSLAFEDLGGAPNVWLFVGVNGVGKTTTIGKLGAQQRADGRSVLLAAGDTFRAAAAEQLTMWAERAGAEIVRGEEGGDPAAVVFDAVEKATARNIDLVLADTAGRLHTKVNLMEELRKVKRVAEKGEGRVTETLLVIDATTGQNGMAQARQFTEAVDVTGVVLTKLDGSAKGGIVLAIQHELGIPVKLVGLGEALGDLTRFEPQEFVDALFE
jgi:fused signal recognition particle receptor